MRYRVLLLVTVLFLGACGGGASTAIPLLSQSGSVQASHPGTGTPTYGYSRTQSWSTVYSSWSVTVQCESVGGTYPVDLTISAGSSTIKQDTLTCPSNRMSHVYNYYLYGIGTYSASFREKVGTVQWTISVIDHD